MHAGLVFPDIKVPIIVVYHQDDKVLLDIALPNQEPTDGTLPPSIVIVLHSGHFYCVFLPAGTKLLVESRDVVLEGIRSYELHGFLPAGEHFAACVRTCT